MATEYPENIDSFINPSATDTVEEVDHAAQHADANDAIEALQAKVGANSSAVTTSHDYKLSEVAGSDKAVSKTAVQTLTNKTLTSPTINSPAITTPTGIVKGDVGLGNVDNTSDATKNAASATLTNKTIDADDNLIENIDTTNFRADVIDTDGSLSANSDTRIPTQQAVKEYVDANAASGGSVELTTEEIFAGQTTPVPAFISATGVVRVSDANDDNRDEFHGFVTSTVAPSFETPTYLNSGELADITGDVTINAGVNRVLIVTFFLRGGETEPTAVTWDGNTMIEVATAHDNGGSGDDMLVSTWYYIAGDSGSNQTGTLVTTGAAGTNKHVAYVVYENASQFTPVRSSAQTAAAGTSTTISANITPETASSIVFQAAANGEGRVVTLHSGFNNRENHATGTGYAVGEGAIAGSQGTPTAISATFAVSAGHRAMVVFELSGYVAPENVDLAVTGVLDGFTDLTPGADYFLQNTIGAIGTSPGSMSIRVGRALTATKLLITQP